MEKGGERDGQKGVRERQRDRETERQRGRETERQRDRERQTETDSDWQRQTDGELTTPFFKSDTDRQSTFNLI